MKKFNGFIVAASLTSALIIAAGCSENVVKADLDRVLDITSDALYKFENSPQNTKDDNAMEEFADNLRFGLSTATPPVHPGPVGIVLKEDGSFGGFHDKNGNTEKDAGESDLFTIEVDSEGGRLLATDASGNTRDHHFSGTGMMAGFLLGSMLSRQRSAGVSPSSLSSKKATPKSAYQSARSRAGSGSHSSGK